MAEFIPANAYFDESGQEDQPGYFGIAGFVGAVAQWNVLEGRWTKALHDVGVPYLHMREFAHSVGASKG
jgi:hypothetical protein